MAQLGVEIHPSIRIELEALAAVRRAGGEETACAASVARQALTVGCIHMLAHVGLESALSVPPARGAADYVHDVVGLPALATDHDEQREGVAAT